MGYNSAFKVLNRTGYNWKIFGHGQ